MWFKPLSLKMSNIFFGLIKPIMVFGRAELNICRLLKLVNNSQLLWTQIAISPIFLRLKTNHIFNHGILNLTHK